MKKQLFISGIIVLMAGIVFAFVFFEINNSNLTISENTSIQFSKIHHNYGTLKLNSSGETEFVFTNSGKSPLLIYNVTTSCGCTVPEWPEKPIRPNNEGSIKINYDTSKQGRFSKSINVFANFENSPVQFIIEGEVVN